MFPILLAVVSAALAVGDTDAPSDTDTDTSVTPDPDPTDAAEPVDTAVPPPCPDCKGAADLAGDEGGSPCATGGKAGILLLFLPALLIARVRLGR